MSSMDEMAVAVPEPEHASTTGRRSARSQRIEVITRGERRRAWGIEQKREIVIESLQLDVRPGGRGPSARHQHRSALHVAAADVGGAAWRGATPFARLCT